MSVADIKKGVDQKMQRSIDAFKNDLSKIRTGRAHTGLLDHIQVDYYGSPVPISQVANLTLIDARTIGVQPWEKKMVTVVEKAIRESDLGLNPASQGDVIRVPMPALTEERRRELVKVIRGLAEEGRVSIRNVRRDTMHHLRELKSEGEASSDDEHRAEVELQKLTDARVGELDAVGFGYVATKAQRRPIVDCKEDAWLLTTPMKAVPPKVRPSMTLA